MMMIVDDFLGTVGVEGLKGGGGSVAFALGLFCGCVTWEVYASMLMAGLNRPRGV